jgi:hypothetical protein
MSSAMIAASCVVFSPGSMDATPPIPSTIKPLPNDQAAALVDEPLREASFGAACRHSRFIRLRKSGALVSAASAPHAVELRLDRVEGLVGVEDGLTVGVHTQHVVAVRLEDSHHLEALGHVRLELDLGPFMRVSRAPRQPLSYCRRRLPLILRLGHLRARKLLDHGRERLH